MKSEMLDQMKRPTMLKMLMKPTKPAAALAVTRPEKISWIIGEAVEITPIPAVTLRHKTAHRSQNCGVLMASWAVTFAEVTSARGAAWGTKPAGRKLGGGIRTDRTPNIMNTR
jgi:hypothetical protein